MARNIVEHGYLLSESSPSQSYSYSTSESETFEQICVPSINGVYATVDGQRVYLKDGDPSVAELDMYSASFTDTAGVSWILYNNFDGERYYLIWGNPGDTWFNYFAEDSVPIEFRLYVDAIQYNLSENSFTGNIDCWVRDPQTPGDVKWRDLRIRVKLDRQFVPQIIRTVTVTS